MCPNWYQIFPFMLDLLECHNNDNTIIHEPHFSNKYTST